MVMLNNCLHDIVIYKKYINIYQILYQYISYTNFGHLNDQIYILVIQMTKICLMSI